MTESAQLQSPCISVCTIDPASGNCLGCHRTRDEIARWPGMDPAEQRALLDELHDRRAGTTGGRRRRTRRRA